MPSQKSHIRVRIAPSPTGNLHVGTARAALFNELFARHEGGKFIIRIEDTDKARSKPEYEKNILEGLHWLGITWDEGPDIGGEYGPYRQSERTQRYQAAIEKLLAEGKAYQAEGKAVKLRVEPQEVIFEDLVRGAVKTHSKAWGGDFVIARSIDDPVFHLAVVVDDEAMQISHIIRGDDHLSNTARHILIQRALGYATPQYGHMPLLLDEQRKKLSKRSGETNLLAYRDLGYLPEAMMNYLAQLGWSPKDDREYLTREELITAFTIDGIQKPGAVFSLEKLQAMNKYYLRKLSGEQLYGRVKPFLDAAFDTRTREFIVRALQTEQERVATLTELSQAVRFFLPDWPADYSVQTLIWKKSDRETTVKLLTQLKERIRSFSEENFTEEGLEKELIAWIDENKLGRGDTLWPMRVALTGRKNSPGPFEVAAVLQKTEVQQRLQIALDKFKM